MFLLIDNRFRKRLFLDDAAAFTATVFPKMSPSAALTLYFFFRHAVTVPSAVDHRAGIGIIPLFISASDTDCVGNFAGSGKCTVVIVDKEVTCFAADRTSAFFVEML